MKFRISRQSFTKAPNIKLHAYPCSESSTDTCGQTDGHDGGGEIDAFRDYANAPKIIKNRLKTDYNVPKKKAKIHHLSTH